MRAPRTLRWTWDFLVDPDVIAEAQTFENVRVRRAKAKRGHVGKVQKFVVPEPMRPIVATWHELHGRPMTGPVFPVTKGPRAGQHRVERGTSYAARLRRELWRLGVLDHAIHNDTSTSKRWTALVPPSLRDVDRRGRRKRAEGDDADGSQRLARARALRPGDRRHAGDPRGSGAGAADRHAASKSHRSA